MMRQLQRLLLGLGALILAVLVGFPVESILGWAAVSALLLAGVFTMVGASTHAARAVGGGIALAVLSGTVTGLRTVVTSGAGVALYESGIESGSLLLPGLLLLALLVVWSLAQVVARRPVRPPSRPARRRERASLPLLIESPEKIDESNTERKERSADEIGLF